MGLILAFLYKLMFPVAFTGAATYYAFKLGPKIAISSRNAGRSLGMGYNYFKVLLAVFTPKAEQANLIIGEFRKGSQQAHAVLREFKFNVSSTRDLITFYCTTYQFLS